MYAISIQIEGEKLFHEDRLHPRRARNTSHDNKKRALKLKADSACLRVMKSSVTITSTTKLLLFTQNMTKYFLQLTNNKKNAWHHVLNSLKQIFT